MKKCIGLVWFLAVLMMGIIFLSPQAAYSQEPALLENEPALPSEPAQPSGIAYSPEAFTRYLEDIYKMEDKKLNKYVIEELKQFAGIFPNDANAPNALFLVAESYRRQKKNHEAFANYLKTLFVYPENRHKDGCLNAIRDIVATDKTYSTARDTLTSILTWKLEQRPPADGYHQFLKTLLDLKVDKLNKTALAEAIWMFEKFPNFSGNDEVLKWTADLRVELGHEHEAAATYLKLEYLFPKSPYLLHCRYNRGLLLYQKLKLPETANTVFEQIIVDYPESKFAGFSQFYIGEIYEKKMKNYELAIENYMKLVQMDSLNQKTVPALEAVAKIQEERLKDYAAAIKTLETTSRLPKVSPNVALDALADAAEISERRLRDYQQAIDIYVNAVTLFPENEGAPNLLYSAAEIAEKRLKDPDQTLQLLTEIKEKYPLFKKMKYVNSKIEKMKEKTAAENTPE